MRWLTTIALKSDITLSLQIPQSSIPQNGQFKQNGKTILSTFNTFIPPNFIHLESVFISVRFWKSRSSEQLGHLRLKLTNLDANTQPRGTTKHTKMSNLATSNQSINIRNRTTATDHKSTFKKIKNNPF
jgi:hypothetical protein